MKNIHDRIEHIILRENLSIAAFERVIGRLVPIVLRQTVEGDC